MQLFHGHLNPRETSPPPVSNRGWVGPRVDMYVLGKGQQEPNHESLACSLATDQLHYPGDEEGIQLFAK